MGSETPVPTPATRPAPSCTTCSSTLPESPHCSHEHTPQQIGGPHDGQVAGMHVGLGTERGHVHQVAHEELQGPAEGARVRGQGQGQV